jgi:diguanylate cyclase (GGDEF)-like protein
MIYALKPDNEKERLESLQKLNILDTPLEERFERITRMVCETLNVPISSFTIIDEGRQWFKSIQGLPGTESDLGLSFCSHVILGDEIMIIDDATKDARFATNPLVTGDPNITFYAGCPVHAPDGHKIGSLCAVDSKVRTLTPEQLQTLRDLAGVIEAELRAKVLSPSQAGLIENLDSDRLLKMTDPLTRLWNSHGAHALLDREWRDAIENQKSICLVKADIDYFKRINGAYGRAAGDKVLKNVSRQILSILRAEDVLARVDDNAFLLILPGVQPEALPAILEHIRLSVAMKAIALDDGNLINTSMSFGAVAVTPEAGSVPEAYIGMADKALTKAKNNGRDRVEIYP